MQDCFHWKVRLHKLTCLKETKGSCLFVCLFICLSANVVKLWTFQRAVWRTKNISRFRNDSVSQFPKMKALPTAGNVAKPPHQPLALKALPSAPCISLKRFPSPSILSVHLSNAVRMASPVLLAHTVPLMSSASRCLTSTDNYSPLTPSFQTNL